MAPEWARGKRGPAKAFDVDKALEAAMLVFWKKGFEGKSLSDLTKAMDINRPSLYATFGDKQQLYGLTLGRFGELGRPVFESSTAESTARRFAERLLRGQTELYSRPELAPGCFLIQSAISTSTQSQAARDEAAGRTNRPCVTSDRTPRRARPTVSEAGPRADGGRADPRGGGGTLRTLTPQELPATEEER